MNWPNLCLMLLTYERTAYARKTLLSALDHIRTTEPLLVHIADDGSSFEHRDILYTIAHGHSSVQGVTISNSERGGYGKNYNLATMAVHSIADIILPLEDDWELTRPLDLDPLVAALREGSFGSIRLGYIGFTQSLRGEFVHAAAATFLQLDPDSPEPHVWSGHPRLETREWQRHAGPWPEGLDPGATEFAVAQRREAREGVVWPTDLLLTRGDLFVHIGTVQARTDQHQEAVSV